MKKIKSFMPIASLLIFYCNSTFLLNCQAKEEDFSFIFQTEFHSINKEDLQVFVINLDRTPERYEKVRKQLDDHNVKHKRYSGVDGYHIKIINTKTGEHFFGKDLKNGKAQWLLGENYKIITPSGTLEYLAKEITDFNIIRTGLTAGEFGCYASHRGIWNRMILDAVKYALVLEDDITLSKEFQKRLAILLTKLPSRWDIIYFFIEKDPLKETVSIVNNPIIKKIKPDGYSVTLTAGYLINLQAAKRLYDLSENFSVAVDDFLSDQINKKEIVAYVTSEPYLTAPVGEKAEDSVIYDMGRPHF